MSKYIPSFKINQIVNGQKVDCAMGWAKPNHAKAMLKGLRKQFPTKHFELETEI